MRLLLIATLVSLLAFPGSSPGQEKKPAPPTNDKGVVHFEPLGDQKDVPERYRLAAHDFSFEMEKQRELPVSGVDIYHIRFPSPIASPCPENNTVHADYFRPRGEGPFPCVIVLDILAGDQRVSRMIATNLAQNRIAALTVPMAYYGPRRPRGSSLRLLSPNVEQTLEAVRQTVLDLRRTTAWMASRPELDRTRLGILGTSLGSFMAALTAEMESRLGRVAVLLGGGGFVDAFYDDRRVLLLRTVWECCGGTKEEVVRAIAPADPITCAANLRNRKLLIMAASRDDIVPPKMAERLYEATGRQRIVWYDCTHLGAILYLVPALKQLNEHFR
jgi:dienelactone hydrolase